MFHELIMLMMDTVCLCICVFDWTDLG